MAFRPLYGLCVNLKCKLDMNDAFPTLESASIAYICTQLSGGHHSYGILTGGAGYEAVKIECAGSELKLTRAIDGTTAREWHACDTLKFEWIPSAMTDLQTQEAAGGDDADIVCDIISDTLDITDVPEVDGCDCDDSCTKRIELKSCDKVTFVVGQHEYTFEDGCLSAAPAPHQCLLSDGVYTNATITVVDGVVCGIDSGSAIIKSTCSPCCDDT